MTNPALAPTPVQRLLSLDVLRGITIAFMIMVNNNGGPGSWGFMNHAAWNGLLSMSQRPWPQSAAATAPTHSSRTP